MTVACNQIMKRIGATRKAWNEHISERVAATSNILAQIKDIKMTGLVPSMIEYLKDLRAKEILVSLRMRRVVCCLYVFCELCCRPSRQVNANGPKPPSQIP